MVVHEAINERSNEVIYLSHVNPSPLNPGKQVHSKSSVPSLSMHLAFLSHLTFNLLYLSEY